MPTPFESATLILDLYEKRREPLMREARDFFVTFDPQAFDEFKAGLFGPKSAYIRMVMSYWDMAASFVNNGAIDGKMFLEATGEFILVFGRLEPLLPQIREMFGNPASSPKIWKNIRCRSRTHGSASTGPWRACGRCWHSGPRKRRPPDEGRFGAHRSAVLTRF